MPHITLHVDERNLVAIEGHKFNGPSCDVMVRDYLKRAGVDPDDADRDEKDEFQATDAVQDQE